MSPVSFEAVEAALSVDEPNYPLIAKALGAEALPHLVRLANGPDTRIGSRAVALAAHIDGPGSFSIVEAASRNTAERVRLAAAGAAPRLALDDAGTVLDRLLQDGGEDVRHAALDAVQTWKNDKLLEKLRPRIDAMSANDPEAWVRDRAVEVRASKSRQVTSRRRIVVSLIGACLLGGLFVQQCLVRRPDPPRPIPDPTPLPPGTQDGPPATPMPDPKLDPVPDPWWREWLPRRDQAPIPGPDKGTTKDGVP
jgi:hypothetical protein